MAKDTADDRQKTPGYWIPVVAIGASAGGLEAFEEFFTHIPPDTGMAFVLIQHLDPTHESLLGGLLGKYTRMPVSQVSDGMRVEANHLYVIPPNHDMTIGEDVLRLVAPGQPRGHRLPIDTFFRSLAADRLERSIGVVLSGTGGDGTLGLRAIKEVGGLTMVQAPASARYDGMPRSAIATGLIDLIVEPARMGARLQAYLQQRELLEGTDEELANNVPGVRLNEVFELLRERTGHDFSGYKSTTVTRRLYRRLAICRDKNIESYVQRLREQTAEVDTLFNELLIGVTSFFRDKQAFEALTEQVIKSCLLAEAESRPRSLRIWVAGCSTGEEAYSLAILLEEHCATLTEPLDYQIFATDINEAAIEFARNGRYPDSIAVDVTDQRLERFFTRDVVSNTYRVKQAIRDKIVFASQSVISHAPFSRLDLISCRNLLIYLDTEVQQRVLPLFHYGLSPGGFLFLGTSETLGGAQRLFEAVDKKWKIFRRSPVASNIAMVLSVSQSASPRLPAAPVSVPIQAGTIGQVVEKILLSDPRRTCMVTSEKGDLLYVHGRSGKYLDQVTGIASSNVLQTARAGLRVPLAKAFRAVLGGEDKVIEPHVSVSTDGDLRHVELEVRQLSEPVSMKGLKLVLLTETSEPRPLSEQEGEETSAGEMGQQARELEQELRSTREYLQTAIEEHETANEELKAANEELQSTNEELQSTNEELQTSKEELQSVNEELITVNAELHAKVDELSLANSDIRNLLENTNSGIIFLDPDLRIRRFTDAVTEVVELIAADVGRPLERFTTRLENISLVKLARQVSVSMEPVELEVRLKGEELETYLLRVMPYRQIDDEVDGVVLVFTDIESMVRAQQALQESEAKFRSYFDMGAVGMVVSSPGKNMVNVNQRFCDDLGYSREVLLQKTWLELTHPGDREADMKMFDKVMSGECDRYQMEKRFVRHDGEVMFALLYVSVVRDRDGQASQFHAVVINITEKKRIEFALERVHARNDELYQALESSFIGFHAVDENGLFVYANPAYAHMWGYASAKELIGTSPKGHCVDPAMPARIIDEVNENEAGDYYFDAKRKDGSVFKCHMRVARLVRADGGRLYHGFSEDITEAVESKEALRSSRERLKVAASAGVIGVWDWNLESEELYWDEVMYQLHGVAEPGHRSISPRMWQDALHPADKQRVITTLKRNLDSGESFEQEFRVLHPGGETRYIQSKARIERAQNGEPRRMVGVNYDITATKLVEQNQAMLNARLESRVRERTRDLVLARDQAEAANQAKDLFLASISHELRTPLNGIMGIFQQELRRSGGEVDHDSMNRGLRAARHLNALINDLLDFASIESKNLELLPQGFRVGALLDEAAELSRAAIEKQGLAFRLEVDSATAGLWVRGDLLRLKQVLVNFLTNARKFTQKGHVTLAARVLELSRESVELRFSVADSGLGIAPAQQERVFGAFEQLDKSDTGRMGGAGLGLAISKRLVEAMNGNIGVDSEPGKGADFWFQVCLPLAAKEPPDEVESESAEQCLRDEFSGTPVLLADDDEISLEIAVNLLEAVGLAVDTAADGEEVLAMVARKKYAAIILDWQMPRISGLQAARQIRERDGYSDVPLLALTAKVFPRDIEACFDAGMSDHIGKPLEFEKLYAKLLRWLRGGKTA